MSVPWLELGSTGKYQHSVSGVPSGCALGNSLDLMLVLPCTPLVSSRYRLSTVQLMFNSKHWDLNQNIWNHSPNNDTSIKTKSFNGFCVISTLARVTAHLCRDQRLLFSKELRSNSFMMWGLFFFEQLSPIFNWGEPLTVCKSMQMGWILIKKLIYILNLVRRNSHSSTIFSSNQPTGPIQYSSRDVRVSVCLSPFSCTRFWGLSCPKLWMSIFF